MSDVEEKLGPLRLAVAEQGNLVKKLKEEKVITCSNLSNLSSYSIGIFLNIFFICSIL
jgi:hypothetical protein